MSTRSNICLVLNKEDIGKVMKFDEAKLPKDVTCDDEFLDMVEEVRLEKPILEIFHHWDGYPECLGKTLLKQYNDYNTILNLLLGGDAISINGDNVCQYRAATGEDWKSAKPKQFDKPLLNWNYLYKFENGVWYFKDDYFNEDWTNLEEYLNKPEEE
jgi:hypothetical protein